MVLEQFTIMMVASHIVDNLQTDFQMEKELYIMSETRKYRGNLKMELMCFCCKGIMHKQLKKRD